MPEVDDEVHCERHYSTSRLAKLWRLSPETVRRLFAGEDSVLAICRQGVGGKARRYSTLRIPESVARRVHFRLSTHHKSCTSSLKKWIQTKLPGRGNIRVGDKD